MHDLEETLSTTDLCTAIGITPRTLRRYRARGLRPRFRLRQYHWHLPTVLSWPEEQAAEERAIRR